jgi:mRNA interferase MazF
MEFARGRGGLAHALTVLPPFAVVAVPFPFVDRARSSIVRGTRRRPALALSTETFYRSHPAVLLAMITTARSSHWASDVVMEDWQAAGLNVPCRVRFKLFTIGASLVAGTLGRLSDNDRARVETVLRSVVALTGPEGG